MSVVEALKCSLGSVKVTENVPFESSGTVSYSHSIANVAVSLAVSIQHTNVNVTDNQPETARQQESRYSLGSTAVSRQTREIEYSISLRKTQSMK